MNRQEPILGVILAGGLARRMGGGDKGLSRIAGTTILQHIRDRVGPQVSALILNANGDARRFEGLGLEIVADSVPDVPGPLAGVLAALERAAAGAPATQTVLSVPCDCPFLPDDLVARLLAARDATGASIVCAASGGRQHPVVALWPVTLRFALRQALSQGLRQVRRFSAVHGMAAAEWPTDPIDPFLNINTASDLAEAERLWGPSGVDQGAPGA